jgi:hypothetical protein
MSRSAVAERLGLRARRVSAAIIMLLVTVHILDLLRGLL